MIDKKVLLNQVYDSAKGMYMYAVSKDRLDVYEHSINALEKSYATFNQIDKDGNDYRCEDIRFLLDTLNKKRLEKMQKNSDFGL